MDATMSARKVIFRILAVIVAIGFSLPASAQTPPPPVTRWISWSLFAGNDYGTGVAEDRRGNFIVSGYITPYPDMLAVKYNSTGKKLWTHFPTSAWMGLNDYAHDAIATSDGGYLIAGTMGYYDETQCPDPANPPPGGCIKYRAACLIKYSSGGKLQWQKLYKEYPYSGFNAVVEDMNGDYVAAGYCARDDLGNPRLLVVKLDSSGTVQTDYKEDQGWEQSDALGISTYVQDNAPSYVVTGYMYNPSVTFPYTNIYIIRLSYGLNFQNHGMRMAQNVDSTGWGVVPAFGATGGYVVAAGLEGEFALVKFPQGLNGDTAEVYPYGAIMGDAKSIKDDGIGYVAAGTQSTDYDSAAYVVHVNYNFDLEWEWSYGNPNSFFGAWSAIPTHDGGFAVCGYVQDPTKDYQSQYDLFLAKLGGVTKGRKN
jgi:hypothetical protein